MAKSKLRRGSASLLGLSLPLVGFASIIVLWQMLVWLFKPADYLFPAFPAVAGRIWNQWPDLASAAWTTGYEVVISFGAAAALGLGTAIALHSWPRLNKLLWPFILFLQITPQVALAPLLIVWFGLGLAPKVIMAATIAFFPMLINAHSGFESVDAETIELGQSMRLSRLGRFWYLELPTALPQIFAGARIAVTYAVVGVVVAEFMASNGGLGNLILVANGALDGTLGFASLLILSLQGVAFYSLIAVAERFATFWHVSQRSAVARGAGL